MVKLTFNSCFNHLERRIICLGMASCFCWRGLRLELSISFFECMRFNTFFVRSVGLEGCNTSNFILGAPILGALKVL